MPRTETGPAAGVQCLACSTMDARRVHDCPAAKGQRGIIPVKAWPGGKPPSKKEYMKAARDAQKKQVSQRLKDRAKPFKAGVPVQLPSRVTPSTEDEIKEFFYPELRSGPVLTEADRKELASIVARAYWAGGFKLQVGGVQNMVAALLAAKVVVEPWKCDWFQGFVDSEADAKKRFAAGAAKSNAARKQEAHERFDDDDDEGYSDGHDATYQQLAKKIAWGVADRDKKARPSHCEIWKNPCYSVQKSNFGRPVLSTRRPRRIYWLDLKNRAGDVCAGCLRKFGGRYHGWRFLVWIEHRNGGPHDGELSDAPSCWQCNTSSRARADAAAAALHVHAATYTLGDSGALAKAHLALMGRGSDDDAAARLARVRAATVTCSADDAALARAQVSTPARDCGSGVERFDPEAVPGSRDGVSMKPCPACAAMIPNGCKKCKECGEPCTKKRKS